MLITVVYFSILMLLLYGCWTDLRWYHVSNRVTYSIGLLSIPLINFGNQLLYAQVLFSIFLVVAWALHQLGAADVKVIIPIIFTLYDIPFVLFLGAMASVGLMLSIIYKKAIPGFIPITAAYASVLSLTV